MKEKHPRVEVGKAPIFSAKVLANAKMDTKRKIREAVEICERSPTINRSKGWML